MNRYALESKKLGAGTGMTAARRRRDIRNYLTSCIPAIPAWIMPIDRVAQFFPAQLEMFDVVIVDEASQARLDSVFLLALSKRVVIVGDHKQVSPDGGMLPVAEIEQIVNRHLADDPRKANWSNADLSLFDECKVAFVNMVTLTEHRRCVPEIIGFSNQIAYIPENIRLIPVRQTGTDALPPVRTIFVEKGYVRGSSGQQVNQPEAEAVAQEVLRMTKDPAYRNMTIGVVTLQGSKQQEVIRARLIDLVPPSEMESRQIRVGMPPDFQGSERNVVLLSMVMAPNQRFTSQTKELMVQRYNVAASRAKDQMVLVHSLRASDIKNTSDLRRQLIDYCQNVERGLLNPVEGAIGQVPNDERVEPFDSLFEQRVHNRIVERGYKVIPQFEPQIDGHEYRIDLVVVGPHGKYAIECDGDFWHGGPEAFEKDLVRQEILQRCGWKFFRIPESRFYGDPAYMDQLWPELEKFVSTRNTESLPQTSESDNSPSWDDSSANQIDYEIDEGKDVEPEFDFQSSGFNPDGVSFSSAGEFGPKEVYIDGLRVRQFPKPVAKEFSWLQTYQSWDREDVGNLSKISTGNWKIMNELKEIIRIEGPILGSYLMRKHYKATGGSSLSSNNENEYVDKLKSLVLREEVIMEEQISGESIASASFRVVDQPPVITRVRGARDLYDIPPREIAMIIRGVMKSRPALSKASARGDLFRQVLLLLDFTKLTKKAEEHLSRILVTYSKEILAK
jgi:very-short-patch-repair endonuclease